MSAEWDQIYESFRDEEEARSRAEALGINREVSRPNGGLLNQKQEPKPTRLEAYRDV